MLQDLRGGFPVPSGPLLEDDLAGPGQLGLQRPLRHRRPGEARGEAALQEPGLRPPVGGGRVDRGRRGLTESGGKGSALGTSGVPG